MQKNLLTTLFFEPFYPSVFDRDLLPKFGWSQLGTAHLHTIFWNSKRNAPQHSWEFIKGYHYTFLCFFHMAVNLGSCTEQCHREVSALQYFQQKQSFKAQTGLLQAGQSLLSMQPRRWWMLHKHVPLSLGQCGVVILSACGFLMPPHCPLSPACQLFSGTLLNGF